MKQVITTQKVSQFYKVIGQANTGKLSDSEKIAFWRISMAFFQIAGKYDEMVADATKKLKPQDEDFDSMLEKVQQFEDMIKNGITDEKQLPIGIAEEQKWMKEVFLPYDKNVKEAIRPYAEKEVTLTFDGMTEEGFEHLLISNDWNFMFAQNLHDIIVETKKEKKNEK